MTNRPDEPADLSALSELAPELARTLAAIAGDIALVIDCGGVIRSVAMGDSPLAPKADEWVGREWADTVTGDTRRKVDLLLQEVSVAGVSRRRQVNLPSASGPDIPVSYAAMRLGEHGPFVAVGRDLRAVAAIQQRFVESQQEMERDYWKKRQAESRYRLLFQAANDAVLVIDAATMQTVEANRAASKLFGLPLGALVGQNATAAIESHSRPAVDELLLTARSTGRPAEMRARLACRPEIIVVSASPFRAESALLLLMRARVAASLSAESAASSALVDFVERTPDAVVITDSSGRLLMVNPAFLKLCQLGGESEWRGRPIDDWVGSRSATMTDLISQVRRQGIATQVSSWVSGAQGTAVAVEISAALMEEGDQESIGLTLRRLGQPEAAGPAPGEDLLRAVEALASQLGRLPMADLMREATSLVERHFLKAALHKAGGDTPLAAALLQLRVEDLRQQLLRQGLLHERVHAAAHSDDDGDDVDPTLPPTPLN